MAFSSIAELGNHRENTHEDDEDKPKMDCLTTNTIKLHKVDLKNTPTIRTISRNDSTFRVSRVVMTTAR